LAELAVFIVEGNVQNVGYRALVLQMANRFGIRGKVQNIDNGKVKIWCEADSSDLLETFRKEIFVTSRLKDPFALNVVNISVERPGSPGFQALGKYPSFEIDYGLKLTPVEKEQMNRLEIATYVLPAFKNETKDSFEDLGSKYHTISTTLSNTMNTINKTFYVMCGLTLVMFLFLAAILSGFLKAA
jgi:acylphosphatase